MQADPIQEWRRLTEHYRRMTDEELRGLAFDFANLTDTARQVLRGEMRSRGLGDPQSMSGAPQTAGGARTAFAPEPIFEQAATSRSAFGHVPGLVPDAPDSGNEDGPHEYTWKTVLCQCETSEQAWQLCEALKKAGIESWIENATRYSPYADLDMTNPRVLVAADQIDGARTIAAQPIPPEIVQASRVKAPEFTPPRCPRCGAEDPVLEDVDPSNSWRCEQCDAEWTESAESAETSW